MNRKEKDDRKKNQPINEFKTERREKTLKKNQKENWKERVWLLH